MLFRSLPKPIVENYPVIQEKLGTPDYDECFGYSLLLPLEDFDVDEIPLEGEIIKEHAGFTDVFFYSDCTNPYAGYVLDLKKLKVYNQYMFPLAMVLNMKL